MRLNIMPPMDVKELYLQNIADRAQEQVDTIIKDLKLSGRYVTRAHKIYTEVINAIRSAGYCVEITSGHDGSYNMGDLLEITLPEVDLSC